MINRYKTCTGINTSNAKPNEFAYQTHVYCRTILHQALFQVLLLLRRFSRVWLCATPQTAAHQAPLSLGFSKQEHWSGLPFPSPIKVKSESEVTQSCLTPSDPMDCSLPGSSIHGIFQARVLEWGAIAFSYSSFQNIIIQQSMNKQVSSFSLHAASYIPIRKENKKISKLFSMPDIHVFNRKKIEKKGI